MIKRSASMPYGTGGGGADGAAPRANGPSGRWRVITVGRTGLEQSLRRESSVELIRARSTFEAVGELSDALECDATAPGDGPHAAPLRCMVLVAGECASEETAGSFVAAVKSMQQQVVVLLVTPPGTAASVNLRNTFDAVVSADASPDEVRRVAGAALSTTAPALVQVKPAASAGDDSARTLATDSAAAIAGAAWAPAPTAAQADRGGPRQVKAQMGTSDASGRIEWTTSQASSQRTSTPATGATGAAGGVDASLLTALLAGRDVLLPALELLHERLGDSSITFVPAGPQTASPMPGLDESLEPVVHSGTLFGHLRFRGPSVGRADRAASASWLSIYLALQAQQTALRTAAMVDDLTGAYNRRYFEHYMSSALAQAQRERHTLTLLVFDLDGFKGFNDRFGHAAGDDILRETVSLLRSVIRPSDKVCRIGGDEFAVIFYEPTGPRDIGSKPPDDVAILAKRFQQQVRAHRFPKLGGAAPGSLTISGGLATFPWDGRTATELLAHADNLALAAKRDGKNAIRIGPDGSTRGGSSRGGDAYGPSST